MLARPGPACAAARRRRRSIRSTTSCKRRRLMAAGLLGGSGWPARAGVGHGSQRVRPMLRVKRLDEAARLLVGGGVKRLPLARLESRRGEHRRRNGEAVGREIFEQPERKGQAPRPRAPRRRASSRRRVAASLRIASSASATTGLRAVRPGTRDQVDQLAPPHRRVVAVFGRLVEDGQQTIVETHWLFVSFGRTLLPLYASIYNALRMHALNHPETGQALQPGAGRKRGAGKPAPSLP